MKLLDHMVEMLRLQFTYRLYIYNTLSVNTVFIFMCLVIRKLFIEQETTKPNGIQINVCFFIWKQRVVIFCVFKTIFKFHKK